MTEGRLRLDIGGNLLDAALGYIVVFIGLFLLIVGIVLILYGHGDFDITGYIASRAIGKNQEELPTALCKNRRKLSGGGDKTKKVASKSVSVECKFFLLLLAV